VNYKLNLLCLHPVARVISYDVGLIRLRNVTIVGYYITYIYIYIHTYIHTYIYIYISNILTYDSDVA
jgi:hypothetical protein